MPSKLYNTKEAAIYLGISERSVREYSSTGRLTPHIRGKGRYSMNKFTQQELDAYRLNCEISKNKMRNVLVYANERSQHSFEIKRQIKILRSGALILATFYDDDKPVYLFATKNNDKFEIHQCDDEGISIIEQFDTYEEAQRYFSDMLNV